MWNYIKPKCSYGLPSISTGNTDFGTSKWVLLQQITRHVDMALELDNR